MISMSEELWKVSRNNKKVIDALPKKAQSVQIEAIDQHGKRTKVQSTMFIEDGELYQNSDK